MPTCFVIQPFDSGKFDKRFEDIYKPAMEQAGLEPYRVDQDPGTEKPIESVEEKIHDATICLADITTDNPNVWYELGFAFAADRSVIMICSNERKDKLPFDIHHRTVTYYAPESQSDFENLQRRITERAKALVKKNAARQVIEAQQVAPTQGLKQAEILVLAIAAAETAIPGTSVSAWSLRHDTESAGLTGIGFAVAIRSLQQKGFVELGNDEDERGERYETVALSDSAWTWIDRNDSLFSLVKEKNNAQDSNDDVPF